MKKRWIMMLFCCFYWSTTQFSAAIDLAALEIKGGEYCGHDIFKAVCSDDHVIQMVNASIGRMRIGQCVSEDPNPACDVDALPVLHESCSGVTRCRVDVSDIDRLLVNMTSVICDVRYRLYLDAHYICVPVETEEDQMCHVSASSSSVDSYPIRVESTEGYLASLTTRETSKGSDRCPWHVRGQPGQTIQVSLLDSHAVVSPTDGVCQIFAYIREGSLAGSSTKLMDCGYDDHGQVFTSLSESIDITIVHNVPDRNFILHFEVVGCPDIQPAGGSEVVRMGNMTHVTCDDVTWKLECDGGDWLGELGECNLPPTDQDGSFIPWPKQWGQELTIVMIISVALVIAVVIVVVGVCIVRRRAGHHFLPVSQNTGEYGVYGLPGPVFPGKAYYPSLPHSTGNHCAASGSDSSHYTTTMQRRQAFPSNGVTPSGDTFPRRTTLMLQQHDVSSCASCPVHACTGYPDGTYPDRTGASGWQTFPIRRAEHLYSSPTCGRKHEHDAPYYHELDPKEVERQLREQGKHTPRPVHACIHPNTTHTQPSPTCIYPTPTCMHPTPTSIGPPPTNTKPRIIPPRPPTIPVPPIPQEHELDSDDSGEAFPPPPPPLPPDNRAEA